MSVDGPARPARALSPEAALRLAVAAATFLTFVPSFRSGLVDWDDLTVTRIDRIASVGELLRVAFTEAGLAPVWVPATWLSLGLDVALLGPGPFGHHLVNAALHAIGAGLLVGVGLQILSAASGGRTLGPGAPVRSAVAMAIGALLWGVHPLRVESVSWVIERKDVLAGVFSLLATGAYLRHAAEPRGRWPWTAVVLHALALAAKPTAVMLPVVWLILDTWPLRRWSVNPRRVLFEKIPSFLACIAVAVVTVATAQQAIEPIARLGMPGRLLLAAQAPAEYVRQLLLPIGLHGFRPLDLHEELFTAGRFARGAATLALTGLAVAVWRRAPAITAAWLAYLALLVPNHALQAGPQEFADRFTYLASIPLCLLVGAAVERWSAGWRATVPLSLAAALTLAAGTVQQQRHWRDAEALWSRNTRLQPGSGFSWARLSRAHLDRGDLDGAIAASEKAVGIAAAKRHRVRAKLEGDLAFLLASRARARMERGEADGALADVERALALLPARELLELRAAVEARRREGNRR